MRTQPASLNGVGAVATLWTIGRYGKLAKRIVVDKELLVAMRESVRTNAKEHLDRTFEQVSAAAVQELQRVMQGIEEQLEQLAA